MWQGCTPSTTRSTRPPQSQPLILHRQSRSLPTTPRTASSGSRRCRRHKAYAAESLREYRRSASLDGEWSGDVEAVKVGHVTHFVAEHGDDESGYDYRLVTAIPAPEVPDWTDVRMELEASGRADLSAWVASKLAAPAPQAAPATVKDSLTDQSPAEGMRG